MRRLSRYLIAASLARLADEMVGVTVVLLVLARTGRPGLAGAAVAAYTLPALISGPLLGAWLDRTRYQRVALAANLGLLAVTMLAFVGSVGRAHPWVPVGLAAMAGVTLPLTSAGFSSLVPGLVPAGHLNRANTLDALTFNGSAIAGPTLAGTLAAAFGPTAAATTLAVVAFAGTAATFALPVPASGDEARPARTALWRLVSDGTRHLARTPQLRGATLTTVVGHGSLGMLAVTLPLFTIGIGAGPEAAGWLWTALEAGSVVGAVAVARMAPTWAPQRLVFCGTASTGVVMAAWPLADSLWTAAAVVAIAGLPQGPVLPAIFSVRQRHTPPQMLAQVSTTGASLKIAGFAAGSVLGGVLAPAFGTTTTIYVVATAHLAAAALGWLAGGIETRTPSAIR